jgi:hypothetical protein
MSRHGDRLAVAVGGHAFVNARVGLLHRVDLEQARVEEFVFVVVVVVAGLDVDELGSFVPDYGWLKLFNVLLKIL